MSINNKKIGYIAKMKNTPRLQGSQSADKAIEILDQYGEDILAVECDDMFAGVFSRSDFKKNILRRNLNPKTTTLYEVMLPNPPSICADRSVKEAYEAMLSYQWDFMPVINGSRLYGIVSIHDLGQDVIKDYDQIVTEKDLIISYIQGGESYAFAQYAETDEK